MRGDADLRIGAGEGQSSGSSGAAPSRLSLRARICSGLAFCRRSPRLLIVSLLLAVILIGTGRHFLAGSEPTLSYRTADVSRGSITSVISASGTLKPETQISVVAQAPGQIVEVLADFNTHVKAGDVLARLRSDVAEARLQIAKADLDVARGSLEVARGGTQRALRDVDNARANTASAKADVERANLSLGDANTDFKRKQELARTGDAAKVETERAKSAASQADAGLTSAKARQTASTAAVASAEAAAAVAQAQEKNALATLTSREAAVRQAQLDVDQTYIRAPIDGVVIDRSAVVGQSVAAGAGAPPMFTIANSLGEMEVHASIDEADIGRVGVGQEARLGFDAFPGRSFQGKVTEIRKTPQVVQGVVSYDVVLSVGNDDEVLLPGMTADVRIIAGERNDVLRVPNAALRFRPPAGSGVQATDVPTVWRLHGGHLQPVTVQTGLSDGVETEIVSGDISAGGKVVVASVHSSGGQSASVGPLRF